MSYLIPESELNILNFNRLIKHTNSYSNEELINKIKENYILYKKGEKLYSPVSENEISMYLSGEWYSLVS